MFLRSITLLILSTVVMFNASVFAFSGSGKHRDREHEWYRSGVDSIGVHVNENDHADVIICKDDEELVNDKCLKKCDDEGLQHDTDGTCTVCVNGNVYLSYMEDPCGTQTPHKGDPNMDCVSNRDCGDGEYCALTTSQTPCYSSICVPTKGICTSVVAQEIPETSTSIYPKGSFMVSTTDDLSWWSAENFCKAQNRHLIKASDFNFQMENQCSGLHYAYTAGALDDWSSLREVLQFHLVLMNDHCNTYSLLSSEHNLIPYHMNLDSAAIDFDAYGQEYLGYALCK